MAEFKVKGSTIGNKFSFIESNFGVDAKDKMVQEFKTRFGDNQIPVLNSTWYPFDMYIEVLEYIAKTHYFGNLKKLEVLGAASANAALSDVYSAFVHSKDYLVFLKKISVLHKLFYDKGKTEVVVHENQKGCDIIHTEKPSMAEADMYVASGFYQETAKLHDLTNIKCSFTYTDKEAKFTLTWQ